MVGLIIILVSIGVLGINYYLFNGLNSLFIAFPKKIGRALRTIYWTWSIPAILCIPALYFLPTSAFQGSSRSIVMLFLFFDMLTKIILLLFFVLDDAQRILMHIGRKKPKQDKSRKAFLKKAGVITSVFPVASLSFGILRGAHDYRWHKITVPVKGLPKQFDGLRIGQLSDIHSGSFTDMFAVKGGIDMFLQEKPDLVLFTGDIVNNRSDELNDYFNIFSKISAPLGVFSTLGNHDYGDYVRWSSSQAKAKNLADLVYAHGAMGWKILRNDNQILKIDGHQLAIVGVENWGASMRFPKYGDLDQALVGAENSDARILMSHDPSHWDAKIIPEHKEIALTLSGHTHGFQFGIETPWFRWSPAQYLYKQWAGLYTQGDQHIYVNRGFGFLGYPGRVGILPELTMITLKAT